MIKRVIFGLVLLAILGAITFWGVRMAGSMEGVEISGHGTAALIIGVVLTVAVGFALMGLLFLSNRSGHDDSVYGHGVLDPEPRSFETSREDKSRTVQNSPEADKE